LQGNVQDFLRVAEIFEAANLEPNGAVLVVTGDLVHGPEIPEHSWPAYLGTFFKADSGELLRQAKRLADRYPDQVYYLVGNHEHAHIGGPIVSKFFPNEALRLEQQMGRKMSREMHDWFITWPLIAVAHEAKLLMMHAAPNAAIRSVADFDRVDFTGKGDEQFTDELLGEILWARTTTTRRARAFLGAIDKELKVAVYGHDVVREGYAIDREPLLCISTSFGCYNGDKLYLRWDLSNPAKNARDVAARGLQPLYPDVKAKYRWR